MPIIATAHQSAHGAIGLHDDGCAPIGVELAPKLAQRIFNRKIGAPLNARIERGAHGKNAIRAELAAVRQLLYFLECPVEIPVGRGITRIVQRRSGILARDEDLPLAEEASLNHVLQHVVGAGAGCGQIDMRREFGRRLEQPRQHRSFRHRDVANRLAEIKFSRRLNAERAAAHIGAIQIELQNLALGQAELQPHGEKRLAHLAIKGAFIVEKQILGQLLRDGGAALDDAGGARIDAERAGRADGVDAPMLVEAAIFRRQDGLHDVIRQLLQRNRIVMLDAAMARNLAVAIQKCDGQILFLQPILGCLAERQRRQRQHQDGA